MKKSKWNGMLLFPAIFFTPEIHLDFFAHGLESLYWPDCLIRAVGWICMIVVLRRMQRGGFCKAAMQTGTILSAISLGYYAISFAVGVLYQTETFRIEDLYQLFTSVLYGHTRLRALEPVRQFLRYLQYAVYVLRLIVCGCLAYGCFTWKKQQSRKAEAYVSLASGALLLMHAVLTAFSPSFSISGFEPFIGNEGLFVIGLVIYSVLFFCINREITQGTLGRMVKRALEGESFW